MKRLVIYTILFLIVISIAGLIFFDAPPEKAYTISTEGQPTIGYANAPVHIVTFEEPKCSTCAQFTNEIFPMIKKDYIDTHKVLYTVIPVSFLPNSMPAAIALLCVYYQDTIESSNLFFNLLDYFYAHQVHGNWATPANILKMAKLASPYIDIAHLEKCLDSKTYKFRILENTNYGQQLLGGRLTTPTVFVNGKVADHSTKHEMKKAIEQALSEKEGYYVERTL